MRDPFKLLSYYKLKYKKNHKKKGSTCAALDKKI
tara:strand:+ start:4937 stop:5038 length:102 start_codon:yes stop_codon:yes gene_type:complete